MSYAMGRRQFLTSAALGTTAVGLKAARVSAESPNNKIVLGVMGMSRGRSLAQGFAKQPGCEVKYVCDVDKNRANAAAQVVGKIVTRAPEAIGDFRRILDDKSVDALVCAAPNHWHAPATIIACGAGKHVYVEKPCCHNPREGEWMVEAARKHNRAVQMGTQRRSGPGTIEAMRLLHQGAIGRLHLARAFYNSARGSIGHGKPASLPSYLDYELWQGPASRRPYLDNRVHYNWHWFWHWGNGELGNNGVHTLDLCRWGMGVDYPIHVTSSGGRYWFDDDQETPDTHTVAFDFEGGKAISWQGLSCNRHRDHFVVFYGESGTLTLRSNGAYTIYDQSDKVVKEKDGTSRGDAEHLANFLSAIRQDKPLSLNAEIAEGYKSTLLCHIGNIAHRTGRSMDCDPANGHIVGDKEAMALWSREYEKGWEPVV